MPRKCQPGVICIENITMIIILFVIIIGYLIYVIVHNNTKKNMYNENNILNNISKNNSLRHPSEVVNNIIDVRPRSEPDLVSFLNPYRPPLQEDFYSEPYLVKKLPINISTNIGAVDASYKQIGILTSVEGKNKILPLMGRPLFTGRDKWQFYTISDQNNSVKLPVVKNGRNCINSNGCDNLYTGDTVFVEGYNEIYKVNIYESDTLRYIPYV
jgi:hypothetical protein